MCMSECLACFRVDTERAFEKMVDALGNIDVQPRVGPLQLDFIQSLLVLRRKREGEREEEGEVVSE